jgi:hypothetical protein
MAPEVLEKFDLAQGALGQNLLAKDIGNLLDGDAFVGLVVHGSTNGHKTTSARRSRRQTLITIQACVGKGGGVTRRGGHATNQTIP